MLPNTPIENAIAIAVMDIVTVAAALFASIQSEIILQNATIICKTVADFLKTLQNHKAILSNWENQPGGNAVSQCNQALLIYYDTMCSIDMLYAANSEILNGNFDHQASSYFLRQINMSEAKLLEHFNVPMLMDRSSKLTLLRIEVLNMKWEREVSKIKAEVLKKLHAISIRLPDNEEVDMEITN